MHVTFPKPERGSALLARKAKRRAIDAEEKKNKREVRKQDRGCRWPFCDCRKWKLRTEVAHVLDKSLGGGNEIENLMELCFRKHQGPISLHSGDLKIEPQTPKGTRGPCDFYQLNREAGRFELWASERQVGVSVMRDGR